MRAKFVESVLSRLLSEGTLKKDSDIIAICAGQKERALFQQLGFTNVTITNRDERMQGQEFAPFRWSYQDAHKLTFDDGQFEFGFVSDGLHHCAAPHSALVELYRVARKGIIAFEARDSLMMRIANCLGLSPRYEVHSVVGWGYKYGGVNNSHIPTFIHRWTEKEFAKTISSYNPTGKHDFRFFYDLNLPVDSPGWSKAKKAVVKAVDPIMKAVTSIDKRQCNSFGMLAIKPRLPGDLWPWLELRNGKIEFNMQFRLR